MIDQATLLPLALVGKFIMDLNVSELLNKRGFSASRMKLVVFDYDGVLMDTFLLTKEIYLEVSEKFNLNLPKDDAYFRELFELDWRETLKKLGLHTPEKSRIVDKLFLDGLRKYDSKVKPYEYIPLVLDSLSKKYILAIATNNLRVELDYRLKKFNLDKYFTAIFTSEDGELKPHPDLLLKCFSRFDALPEESAFVGDMDGDIMCGKAAKVGKMIAVTYGYHEKHRLKDADFIIDSPKDLLALL